MKKGKDQYPDNWKEIRGCVLHRAKNECELCGAPNHRPHWKTGSRVVLTVHHIDNDTRNNKPYNLLALCQRCHLRLDLPFKIKKREREREAKVMEDYKGWSFSSDFEIHSHDNRIIFQNIHAYNYDRLKCPLKLDDIDGYSSQEIRKKLETAIDVFELNLMDAFLDILRGETWD